MEYLMLIRRRLNTLKRVKFLPQNLMKTRGLCSQLQNAI